LEKWKSLYPAVISNARTNFVCHPYSRRRLNAVVEERRSNSLAPLIKKVRFKTSLKRSKMKQTRSYN
jgi:hypothetical protein